MKIDYISAPCGAGKSFHTAKRILACPGHYVIVRDRIEAIDEYIRGLEQLNDRGVPVVKIVSRQREPVRHEIESVPDRFGSLPHVIVIITHRALLKCDFSHFVGWHIVIDETPAVIDQQALASKRSADFFARHYQLTPTGKEEWSSVTLTRQGWSATAADIEGDELAKSMRVFHERVTGASDAPAADNLPVHILRRLETGANKRAVLANLTDWTEMEDGRRWTWWSLWSPKALEAFETVIFLGNGFEHSMSFQLMRTLHPEIEWRSVAMNASRAFKRRSVTIRYFARAHTASANLFAQAKGESYLRAIVEHLQSCGGDNQDQIWMTNDATVAALSGMPGARLQPMQAGSNAYADRHQATAIYSAKPAPEVRLIMDLLAIDPDVWTASNEYETILQFMTRTSLRDPDSTSPVHLTVYDEKQAQYLALYLNAQPYCDVDLMPVDLGFMDRAHVGGRPKKPVLSVEEAEAKATARRKQNAEAARRSRERKRAGK